MLLDLRSLLKKIIHTEINFCFFIFRKNPEIKWLQDKYNVVLRVDVHDVRSSNPVNFMDNMITFRYVGLKLMN